MRYRHYVAAGAVLLGVSIFACSSPSLTTDPIVDASRGDVYMGFDAAGGLDAIGPKDAALSDTAQSTCHPPADASDAVSEVVAVCCKGVVDPAIPDTGFWASPMDATPDVVACCQAIGVYIDTYDASAQVSTEFTNEDNPCCGLYKAAHCN